MTHMIDPLDAISTIDGRYREYVEELAEYFSERALMRYRIAIEIEYLFALSEHPVIGLRQFTKKEQEDLEFFRGALPLEDARVIKKIESEGYANVSPTNHDVKAIEYCIKIWLQGHATLHDAAEWVHFALTSEDTDNLAFACMLRNALEFVMIPKLIDFRDEIEDRAHNEKDTLMLGRTHEQPAVPTTFGKELKFFSSLLSRQLREIQQCTLLVKLNGAVGNYNAHVAAYPHVDWIQFTKDFVTRLNVSGFLQFAPNLITVQNEPHDTYAKLCDLLRRINTTVTSFACNMRRYLSDAWVTQKAVAGEVGSSTMPPKVNPIGFDNSEGSLTVANALLSCFSSELPKNYLQRHFADSAIRRNFGYAFALTLVGYIKALENFRLCRTQPAHMKKALGEHEYIIAEGIQTILRREGVGEAYEQLKELTRGASARIAEVH